MSWWIQLSVLCGFAAAETDMLVVGIFAGVAAAGLLDIGSKLARALLALAWHFNNAFMPAVAALEVDRGSEYARTTAVTGSRYVGLVSFLVSGFLIAGAPLILRLWLGSSVTDVRTVALVVTFLSLGFVVNNLIGVATTVLRALGTPKLESVYSVVAAVTKLALVLALAPRFGIAGVLWGALASTLLSALFFTRSFESESNVWLRSIAAWIPRVTIATIGAGLLAALAVAHTPAVAYASRPLALVAVLAIGLGYLAAFFALLRAAGFFETQDLRIVRSIAPPRFSAFVDGRLSRALLGRAA